MPVTRTTEWHPLTARRFFAAFNVWLHSQVEAGFKPKPVEEAAWLPCTAMRPQRIFFGTYRNKPDNRDSFTLVPCRIADYFTHRKSSIRVVSTRFLKLVSFLSHPPCLQEMPKFNQHRANPRSHLVGGYNLPA